ncbi:MAG: hypothetical protein NWE88_11165 [Candidatus Bathyarchaeota archaeon]|nr:hypothetical protein [Candidatus Bathyarchaeota archaeon]
MYYEWTFTIPANTAEAAAEEHELIMDSGVIVGMSVYNAPGCHRVCRCRILEELSVLWPGNPEGYIATDGDVVKWTEHYVLKSPKYRLILRAWNVSENHPHDIVVRINVLPPIVASPFLVINDLVNVLKHLIGMD